MEPIITRQEENWTVGHIGPFQFQIKHFDRPGAAPESLIQPRQFRQRRNRQTPGFAALCLGIDCGRISKLWLGWEASWGTVAAYNRGWDKLPDFGDAQLATDTLCAFWN